MPDPSVFDNLLTAYEKALTDGTVAAIKANKLEPTDAQKAGIAKDSKRLADALKDVLRGLAIDVSVTVPSQSATVSVTVPAQSAAIAGDAATVTQQSASGTATVVQKTASGTGSVKTT